MHRSPARASRGDICGSPLSPTQDRTRPCQATANVVLEILETILEEHAEGSDGRLHIDDVRQIIDQFKDAPGRLDTFYDETFDHCRAAAVEQTTSVGERREFAAKVRDIVSRQSGDLALGRLQLVGLHAVRDRLGDRWNAALERVHAVADGVIRHRLSPGDTFLRNSAEDIIICFADLSHHEAWLKAKLIEQEIRERLLGCEEDSTLDGLDLDFETISDVAELATETHEVAASFDDVESETDICALVAKRLEAASQAMHLRADEYMDSLKARWLVEPRLISGCSGAPARLVIADVGRETRHTLDRLLPIVRDDAASLVKIDMLALGAAARFLCQKNTPPDTLLAVSVHATSVADPAAFDQLSAACENMAHEIRDRLILVLADLPKDAGPSTLGEAMRRLRKYSRLQALRLKTPLLDDLLLRSVRIPIFLVDFAAASALLRREPQRMRRLLRDLGEIDARLLVDDVPGPADIDALRRAGVKLWSFRP